MPEAENADGRQVQPKKGSWRQRRFPVDSCRCPKVGGPARPILL